jgi:exopolysaccharide/PEP-CTERM locus tyrosine autokinase
LLKGPASGKTAPTPEIKSKVASPIAQLEETTVSEHVKHAPSTGVKKRVGTELDMSGKMVGKKAEQNRSPALVPGVPLDYEVFDKNLVSLLDPQSFVAEQFKMLRTSILYPVSGAPPQSILVTSPLPGEGKSFVSANLAISIAMNINKYVLLVDCDLRKPDLHRIFGYGDVPGLSDYLAEHRGLDSLLLRTGVEKLTLLPGGPIPSNPSELMSSERMSAMLEEVKHRYHDRLIVIDSPPPGLAAETSFLARQVDGIILVVKHAKTPTEEVEDLMEKVGSEKIVGAVINHLDVQVSKRYGYGKYGNYGKRYGTYGNKKK